MINSLRASGKTAVLVSEENEEAVIIEGKYKGKYCVVFDPLDGSSNIDAGVNIGTIFGIYQIVSTSLCLFLCFVLQFAGFRGSDGDPQSCATFHPHPTYSYSAEPAPPFRAMY